MASFYILTQVFILWIRRKQWMLGSWVQSAVVSHTCAAGEGWTLIPPKRFQGSPRTCQNILWERLVNLEAEFQLWTPCSENIQNLISRSTGLYYVHRKIELCTIIRFAQTAPGGSLWLLITSVHLTWIDLAHCHPPARGAAGTSGGVTLSACVNYRSVISRNICCLSFRGMTQLCWLL